jgi:hypothetical protein
MTHASRTEEWATSASAKPWLSAHRAITVSNTIVSQEKTLAGALHFQSPLESRHKTPRRPAMTRLRSSVQPQKRLWRHEAVKLKSSCNDKTVHNKSCCAARTHVSRDNYTHSYMYTSMDIYIHILTYLYLHMYINVYKHIYIYIYTYIRVTYIYIYTTQEERPRRPAIARLRSSVQPQKTMTTWSSETQVKLQGHHRA